MKQRDNIKTKVRGVSVVCGLSSFCVLALLCVTLSTCENPQVIAILSAPSELDFLGVIAYAKEYQIPGGASLEPGYRKDVFEYTVYVDKDTTHITINAGINDKGSVTVYSENDQITGTAATRFDLLGDEAQLTVMAQREYMERAEYRLTVKRGEPVPTARDVEISVEPGIAAFFIGSNVLPLLRVTAVPPEAGVALNYQWYVNDQNNTRTGNPISNANEDSYRMQEIETQAERSIYYYVEITNVIGGKTGTTQSAPCRVTFVNKGRLSEKSLAMADIRAGTFQSVSDWPIGSNIGNNWSTPGFRMGKYLVTWELWKLVFDHAEAGNYSFTSIGNQGASVYTIDFPQPVGNALHPVTNILWNDAVVWCNAYSEMDGKEPAYRNKNTGEPLRSSRDDIADLYDPNIIAGYNGYRLPAAEEWYYAARGANPNGVNLFPGSDSIYDSKEFSEVQYYIWALSPEFEGRGEPTTGEAGSLLPNQIWDGSQYVDGLYDLFGMVNQWIDNASEQQYYLTPYGIGGDFMYWKDITTFNVRSFYAGTFSVWYKGYYYGFRIVSSDGE